MNSLCSIFQAKLYHFQADELSAEERRPLQSHLDECPDCARRMEVEQALLGAVRRRLGRQAAPVGLETRVRASLDDLADRSRPARWFWSPGLAFAAASLLLAALLIGLPRQGLIPDGPGRTGFEDVSGIVPVGTAMVTVVDHDCDRLGKSLAQQRGCRHRFHLNALKVVGGGYWNLGLSDDVSRRLAVDPEMRGHRLKVEGELFAPMQTLHLKGFEDLGLVRQVSRAAFP